MPIRKTIHKILPVILFLALFIFFEAFTDPSLRFDYRLSEVSPTNIPIIFLQKIVYTPEFNLNVDSVEIPQKRAGRLFLIEAKVGNQTGNLVFDTGANGLVLNSTYFRDYVKTGGSNPGGVTGAVGFVEQIMIDHIEFSNLSYKNISADITNLGHIENKRGIKILGLIGFSMMRKLEIVLDINNNQLKLFRIDKEGKRLNNSASRFNADHTQKIESTTNILFLKGMIGGKMLNFCLDTGCETNVICSDCNRTIMNTLTITRRSEVIGAGNGSSEVLFGRMNDFTIGQKKFPVMEMVVTNLEPLSESYGTKTDGMLGYDFLKQGIVCINFVSKQFGIRFTKGVEG